MPVKYCVAEAAERKKRNEPASIKKDIELDVIEINESD
jgi:hypothetical protein